MVTIPICLDRFYLPKKSILWSFLYILERVLFHGKIACYLMYENKLSKIDINFSSDLYRIKYFSCIKQFSCINGITSLYNLPCYCNAVSPLWNSTVCMFIWLKHNDCGLFFLLFFLVKFMSARLEKCSTV